MELCPRKYNIKDLVDQSVPTDVWIQGTIEQTAGTNIIILSDSTGKAKISNCESADGVINKNSLCKGTYCCVLGVTITNTKLPEIKAVKIVDLSAQLSLQVAWDTEVTEANHFLNGKLLPKL